MTQSEGEQFWRAQIPEAFNRPGNQDQHFAIYGLKADHYRRTHQPNPESHWELKDFCGVVSYGIPKVDFLTIFFYHASYCMFPDNDNG